MAGELGARTGQRCRTAVPIFADQNNVGRMGPSQARRRKKKWWMMVRNRLQFVSVASCSQNEKLSSAENQYHKEKPRRATKKAATQMKKRTCASTVSDQAKQPSFSSHRAGGERKSSTSARKAVALLQQPMRGVGRAVMSGELQPPHKV